MTQRMRGLGDLSVRLDPAGAKYGQQTVVLESIREPKEVRELLSRQANVMRTAMLNYQHEREIERRQAGAINLNVGAQGPSSRASPPPVAGNDDSQKRSADEIMDQLRKLGELRDAGVLTDAEFESKKSE